MSGSRSRTSCSPSRRPVRYIVGIDIGGTNVVVGTVAEDGSDLLGLVSAPTISEQGAEAVIERIVKLTRASMEQARGKEIAGVGIGSPGPLNTKTGIVLLTPNLGWTNFPLRDRLGQALGLPATLDNDANCAIFGEWWRGAARGSDYGVGFTSGTGIGGGILLAGKIYRGVSGVAGETVFAPLRGEAKRRAFNPAVDACRIVPGELTGTAGVYGAAAVFVQRTWGTV